MKEVEEKCRAMSEELQANLDIVFPNPNPHLTPNPNRNRKPKSGPMHDVYM